MTLVSGGLVTLRSGRLATLVSSGLRQTHRDTQRDTQRETENSKTLILKGRETQRERELSNSKTLFYKDCSLGSVKNLTSSPC